MRSLIHLAPLFALAACTSTPKSSPPSELADGSVAEVKAALLAGPDGWNYLGIAVDGSAPEFILTKDDERYTISGEEYSKFVPTLGGNVFAVDEMGIWWHFVKGERTASMPWSDLRRTGEIEGDGASMTGAWPAQLTVGGCAKVNQVGEVIESYPDAVALELVMQTWIIEDADGLLLVDAPGGEPMSGGVRYAGPQGAPLVYFPDERMLFDPLTLDFKRMTAVPSVRVLATEDQRLLLGLVPTFDGDETVALYDYYAGTTLERQQTWIERLSVREPAYSPHLQEGVEPTKWEVILCFAASDGHWSAYAINTDREAPRLELVLRGTGDLERATRLLEAELVSRLSHEMAP